MLFRFKHISVISNNFLVEGRYTFFNLPKKLIANYMNYTHPIATYLKVNALISILEYRGFHADVYSCSNIALADEIVFWHRTMADDYH